MTDRAISIGLLADFNLQNLAVLLEKQPSGWTIKSVQAPFGQTTGMLLDQDAEFWSAGQDALVAWTAPQIAVPSFAKVLAFEPYSVGSLLEEVDAFADLLKRVPDSIRTIIVPSWVVPPTERGWGPLDMASGLGVANALMRMNLRFAEAVAGDPRVFMLDAHRWMTAAGFGACNPKLWYLSKTPFHSTFLSEASKDVIGVLDAVAGRSKKIVILDLDNTLWGGIVGDIGWEKLCLGGHDGTGEAYVDFQKALKRLINRGVTLAIVSKNEESVALEAIDHHPEMVLRRSDFVGWRINWEDKAQNIVDLLSDLNLGLEAAVFLDDSPFERGRIREALPQVFVPDLPSDVMQYPAFLSQLRCFDSVAVSSEDRSRTRMYVADRSRTELHREVGSLTDWLRMLDLHVDVEPLSRRNLERAAQLLNKTNQMNLTTRRLSAAELLSWSQQPGHLVCTFRIRDKFGDYGLCGITSLVRNGATVQMLDFLLSCRVMGRGIEDAMLALAQQHAQQAGCDTFFADYVPSPKNEPCGKWLRSLPSADKHSTRLACSLSEKISFPAHITLTVFETAENCLVSEPDEKISV
jgi:FkbH-like protein